MKKLWAQMIRTRGKDFFSSMLYMGPWTTAGQTLGCPLHHTFYWHWNSMSSMHWPQTKGTSVHTLQDYCAVGSCLLLIVVGLPRVGPVTVCVCVCRYFSVKRPKEMLFKHPAVYQSI